MLQRLKSCCLGLKCVLVGALLAGPWWAASQSDVHLLTEAQLMQLAGKKQGGSLNKARMACRRGDAISCYEYGQYLEEDRKKAEAVKEAYGPACDELSQHVTAACAKAGQLTMGLYRQAKQKNLTKEAEDWFRRGRQYLSLACDKDVLASCYNLGALFFSKPELRGQAVRLFKRACVEVVQSCRWLARTLVVKGEYDKAHQIFLKACNKFEDPSSCYQAGDVLDRHLNDHDGAMKLWQQACNYGFSPACMAIAKAHENQGNFEGAVEVLEPLCHQDFSMQACSKLAKLEEKLGHISRAIAAYRQVCEQARGGAWACYDMGLLEEKRGRASKAKKAFAKACANSAHAGISVKACQKACNSYRDVASCKRLNAVR